MERVVRNILDNTVSEILVLLVTEDSDRASCLEATRLEELGLCAWTPNERKKNYAGSVNTAYRNIPGSIQYLFLAADDLDFRSGWDVPALEKMQGDVRVVGTNDLHNPYVLQNIHATHYLIDRRYLEDPGGVPGEDPGNVLFEGYDHNYTDTEFIDAAKARGVFAPCLESVVEHLHVDWGLASWDETYAKGHANVHGDLPIFKSREHLWAL
jgi:hypothetical protein